MNRKTSLNLPLRKGGERVLVAMSGGVDSSVCAALLKKRGFEVRGIFMQLFDTCDKSSRQAARAVAKKLDIKFRVFDLRKEFKKRVINYFLLEFKAGRTPNPCVACNQQIKFGLLLDKAMEMGGDYIATGHYVKKSKIKNQKSKLLVAKDKTKDQSYFLYNLTQKKLTKTLFPLGEYKKSEVYKMAEEWRLPYKKGESVDICFIGKKGHREFLKKYLGVKTGKIIDTSGKVLGKHQGLWFYTIGQRADVGGPGPFYVVDLDVKKNAVVVSNKFRDQLLYKKSLIAEKVNWILGAAPKLPLKCKVRIRYGHTVVPAIIWGGLTSSGGRTSRKLEVEFKNPQRAITPGQSIVFYKRNEVLGGGVIR